MKTFSNLTEVHSEIIQIWETAWEKQPTEEAPLVIKFPDYLSARNARQLLYTARKKMIEEHFHNAANLNKLTIKLVNEVELHFCIPRWLTALRAGLEEHGVEVPPMVTDDLAIDAMKIEPGADEDQSVLGQTIKELFGNKGVTK